MPSDVEATEQVVEVIDPGNVTIEEALDEAVALAVVEVVEVVGVYEVVVVEMVDVVEVVVITAVEVEVTVTVGDEETM